MKRKDLIRLAVEQGCELVEGGNHTKVYRKGRRITEIPRHTEINELTAKAIVGALRKEAQ